MYPRLAVFVAALLVLVTAGKARAQSSRDCSTPIAPGIGVSLGRSSPYVELAPAAVGTGQSGSISVRSGLLLEGRVDLPIAGPWRGRVEGSAARWRVERQTFGDGFQPIATDTIGHVGARQLFAMVGRQGGRSPVCGYVLVGGGIYSLGYKGATVRRPGVALVAGVEVPAGNGGAVQADLQLHVINTGSRFPISSSRALAASISVGWSHRF